MILERNRIFDSSEPILLEYDLIHDETVLPGCGPIRVTGQVDGQAGIAYLAATAGFTLSFACDRCAAPASKQYGMPLNHVLVTSRNHPDRDDLVLVPEGGLDLDELVLSDILLNLPMKQLCQPDCKGLCARCGHNLNEGACRCETKEVDPRLESLKNLLNRQDSD